MSDEHFVAVKGLDPRARRLLCHLSLVGLIVEDRPPARERLEAKIGDLTPFCLAQAVVEPARADASRPGQTG